MPVATGGQPLAIRCLPPYIQAMADIPDPATAAADDTTLIYDGECPVCTAYSCAVGVDDRVAGGLRRIDARSDDALVARATAAGLDLDDGMVVIHRGTLYHGADALHLMARLAPASGLRNRLNRLLFGSKTVAHLSYPLLRTGRNILLRLLGRKKIGNLDSKNGSAR